LHLGSLVTAAASYLHARQARGEWLVRIDDIDPPRELPGVADHILRTLEAFDLEWDRTVLYQSSRLELYRGDCRAAARCGPRIPLPLHAQRAPRGS
jgi:glutamyl-Q tRNA(Asp) synthetase